MKLFFTNLLTAIIVCVLTSLFWMVAYSNGASSGDAKVESAGQKADVRTKAGTTVAVAEGLVVGPSGLAIPVAKIEPAQLVDTFTQARAGGARVHDAIDIMAAEGTPVFAAAPGTVEKIFFSDGGGGNTVYVRSDDGNWTYYYAHLRDYASGLAEGQKVRQGTPLGTVGHTGNASPDGPHLHFAINRMQPGEKWYQGNPINPYPLLAAKKTGG
jgi:murein DD-endopeptidase MepM/ murein hydrolase activator NlpD